MMCMLVQITDYWISECTTIIIDRANMVHTQANTFTCAKSSKKEKNCQEKNVIVMGNLVNQYKNVL